MKTKHFFRTTSLLGSLLLFFSLMIACSGDDDPAPVNEEEVITRVTLVLTGPGGAEETYAYNVGDEAPQIIMENGLAYEVNVIFEDASNPEAVEDVTEEVKEEADDHFVFYQVTDAPFTVESAATDVEDTEGTPIGLITRWVPTASGNGTVTVYLIHKPATKTGSVRDDFGGEDDVQLTFNVSVIP